MEVEDRAEKYLLKSESIGSILIDKFRRPYYIRFIFTGKCKDAMQLSLVEDLEKLRIPYSGGIVYNPDAIISMVNYIQLCSIYPEYKEIPLDVKVEHFYLKNDESELVIWDPFIGAYRATGKFIVVDLNAVTSYWVDISNNKATVIYREDGQELKAALTPGTFFSSAETNMDVYAFLSMYRLGILDIEFFKSYEKRRKRYGL